MLRRAVIAAVLVALAAGVAAPPPARAVPVPMEICAPAVAPGALPCLRADEDRDDSALAAVARSGAGVLWKVWNTTALVFF